MEEDCSAVIQLLSIITYVHLSSSHTHSLQYLYTVNGQSTAVGLVDGEQFVSYHRNIRKMIPKTEWMKKMEGDDPRYWETETQDMKEQQEKLQGFEGLAKQRFNHTKENHTLQLMYGCERDDDVTTGGYHQYGYDGEDFISLNLRTGSWTAVNDKVKSLINDWDRKGAEAEYWKHFLETDCLELLKRFVLYGRESLERKVRPELSVFQKHSSPAPEVVCHATGFFPKALNITWQKDGEDVHEDVELGETLPNQDGSFQKRSILKVPAEELQKHTYTCVVQHSSLEKELEREVPKGGGSGGAPIAIIVGVIIALLVLAAVVAGVVIYKKKNSGFKPVPPKPSSEGDSSSNDS